MKSFPIICCIALCWACARDKDIFDPEALKKYTESFRNRSEIKVDITSEYEGAFYSVFYQYPYEEESLVKTPALTGRTPIHTTLQVPHDVNRLYIIANGELHESDVKDLRMHDGVQTKAATTNPIPAEVLTVINSQYFPEATNNVRGEDLFKCTDLVIAETESTGDFNEAEVWMTFIGDGGSRQGSIYGKCWFYTYPSEKVGKLKEKDCTFYGLINGEIKPIDYKDIKAEKNYIFYTKEEIVNGVSSYKKYKLGAFPKGVNVGFVYYSGKSGKTVPQFTTPRLNKKVENFNLNYKTGGSFWIRSNYLANGFIRHIEVGDFEGNVLGLENRSVTEKDRYDGDYNDMLCLIESNPLALKPVEPIDPPKQDEYKREEGIYLFEDNYPRAGDFDFNDVVVQYQIIDFHKSSNGAKQLTAKLLAKGADYTDVFGFRVDGKYIPLLKEIKGYQNVGEAESFQETGILETQTVYAKREVKPYLYNGEGYICDENYNTGWFPYVLEIPISDPDDESWKFLWCREGKNIDQAYYFLKSKDGGERAKNWYKECKDDTKVFKR